MNEGFSRLLQRADCRKNAPHRNTGRNPAKNSRPSNPTKTAITKKPPEPENFPDPDVPPLQKMPRTAMGTKSREKQPPVKSNQDGDYQKNHPNRRISPIRMFRRRKKCPAPQCGTKSREKQPPSNPTKTAITKKPSEPGTPDSDGLF